MSARAKIEIGDCFRIPLPDGRWAYCQFVHMQENFGYLVQVFDRITPEPLNSTVGIEGAGSLFPPVFVGLPASVAGGRWVRIGTMPVKDFVFPKFRQAMGTKPGTYDSWRIWDGKREIKIGNLPEQMRSLELKCIWGCDALADRIVAGTYRGDRMF